jgi:radical SAM protein with 4Fe4S-binding SPASM domain
LKAGNVFETSLREIWEHSELFKDLRNFRKYGGKCGICKYLGVCGGCRARAYAVYDNYLAEEPFCSFIPKSSNIGG